MSALYAELLRIWPELITALHLAFAITATVHAVMTKDEPRATIGWVGLVWLSPIVGAVLYYLLGINRIRRKALSIKGAEFRREHLVSQGPELGDLAPFAQLGDLVVGWPLTRGNAVTPLRNGDEAYPAMLAAIREAKASIAFASYIFDYDAAGMEFLVAMKDAVARGVQVRVLIDATGARYSFPSVIRPLKKAGIRVARFLPNFVPTRMSAINLRNHRKFLVVDGKVGFTGGMNIGEENYLARQCRRPIQDLHFQVEGPVVGHLRQAFAEDWAFTTKEVLAGDAWFPPLEAKGDLLARGVLDGPDKDFEKILWTIFGVISRARKRIRIVTPYFLPEPTTIRFLNVAAMTGVTVEILLPERTNIPLVQWATLAVVPPLLQKGCKIYRTPPPFDHTKMMLVDDTWVFFGSANWDTRSLRLNFEFNVECYGAAFAARMNALFDEKLAQARPMTLAEVEGRRFPAKLRDGAVRLLAPYL